MTTVQLTRPAPTRRVPASVRGAQALLLLPLGAVQFVAAIAFSITLGWHSPLDVAVAGWVLLMAPGCVAAGLRLGRRRAAGLRAALLLLAAQTGFCAVKLAVYHESAGLVFAAFVAAATGLLVLPGSRRHFAG